ncbi:MAG: YfhH family protein [Bacillaceae bacterium]
MKQLYSEMPYDHLIREIANLREQARKAEQMGMVNEVEVLMRKIAMAQSYMFDPKSFKVGQRYELVEQPGVYFTISYLNGVFAWGVRDGETEEIGIPIALLRKEKKDHE